MAERIKMKYITTILLLTFTMLLLAGCSKKIAPTIEVQYRDSIVEKKIIVPKDTIIYLSGDTITMYDVLDCEDYYKADSSKNLTLSVKIKNGKITATCMQDSLQKRITILEEQLVKEQYSNANKITKEYVQVDKPVKHIPKWVWYLLTYSILITAYFFKNPILKTAKHLLTKWN